MTIDTRTPFNSPQDDTPRPLQYIVMTTIHDPQALDAFALNIAEHGHLGYARVLIIGDARVDSGIIDRVGRLNAEFGDVLVWVPLVDQQNWLHAHCPSLASSIPLNSDNRRNVGYLMAYAEGADVLVSVDDDNFPLPDTDFVAGHNICQADVVQPSHNFGRWFNVMTLLDYEPAVPIWPRGFPYSARTHPPMPTSPSFAGDRSIGINVGLWLGDPDVDAITRISIHPNIHRMNSSGVVLYNSYTPVNSQNTAITRQLIPAYYFLLQNHSLQGWPVNRFGDIWQGFIAQHIAYHLGYAIALGNPLVRQERNDHDLLVDLRQELPGILIHEWVADTIIDSSLTGTTASDAFLELLEHLIQSAEIRTQQHGDVAEYFKLIRTIGGQWIKACEEVS